MNSEIKAQWVAALRSGDYQQGQKSLRTLKDEFCCLGVLSDLYVKGGEGEWVYDRSMGHYNLLSEGGFLPRAVAQWAGAWYDEIAGAQFTVDGRQRDLIDLNDSQKMPFTSIANLIESSDL
jgi:hypothetical protein